MFNTGDISKCFLYMSETEGRKNFAMEIILTLQNFDSGDKAYDLTIKSTSQGRHPLLETFYKMVSHIIVCVLIIIFDNMCEWLMEKYGISCNSGDDNNVDQSCSYVECESSIIDNKS